MTAILEAAAQPHIAMDINEYTLLFCTVVVQFR